MHILLFEELKESQALFARRFAQLLSVDAEGFLKLMEGNHENASLSRRAFWLWRLFGGLLPRRVARQLAVRRPRRPGPAPRIDLPSDVGAHLAQLCAADNMRLMRTYGVNLARHGYTLSPPSRREQDEGQSVAASAVAGAYR